MMTSSIWYSMLYFRTLLFRLMLPKSNVTQRYSEVRVGLMTDMIYKLVQKFNIVSCTSGCAFELYHYKIIQKNGGERYIWSLEDGRVVEQINDDEFLLSVTKETFKRA